MQLPISTMRYDITMPLLDGRVQIPGVELAPGPTAAMGLQRNARPGSPATSACGT